MVQTGEGEMKLKPLPGTLQTLKEFRNDRGMTQRFLADLLGVDASYISQIEIGAYGVTDRIKANFIEIFGVDFEEMYKDVPKKKLDKKTMPKKGQPSDIAYENLAIAIINQAKRDYDSIKRRPTALRTKEDHLELDELRRFFRSGWFDLLCMQADSQLIRKELGIK